MPITPSNPFKGRQFPGAVIILCVRWYLRYPPAYGFHASYDIQTGASRSLFWVGIISLP
jgi:hypothetical protein